MRYGSIIIILVCSALVSCGAKSENLIRYQSLTGHAQINYARSLSVVDRVGLYSEIYDSSRHPRDSSLSIAFMGEGDDVAKYVLSRMSNSKDFIKYIWIIKLMDQSRSVNACSEPLSIYIGGAAREFLSSSSPSAYVSFRECSVVDLM